MWILLTVVVGYQSEDQTLETKSFTVLVDVGLGGEESVRKKIETRIEKIRKSWPEYGSDGGFVLSACHSRIYS